MLPYFKILPRPPREGMQDIPTKPKRNRKPEVQVHRQDEKRNRSNERGDAANELQENVSKISRRCLTKENERLSVEKQELLNSHEHLNKKNCKLKEKLALYQNANEELANENNLIKAQYEELVNQYNDCVLEIEKSKSCQNCVELTEHLDKTKRDYMTLKKTMQELHEDCVMLKNVVFRLNVQLERYQQKVHSSPSLPKYQDNLEELGLGEGHSDHLHSPVTWGKVNSHTLAPLLNAYQEAIAEKDEIIAGYQTELAAFTVRLKEIVGENGLLHRRLTEDNECSKVLGEQLVILKEELKTTKDQNDLLIKKCALKQDKIEEILKCYEQKIEQLKTDYKVLHDQYCKSRTEVASLKERNKSLVDAQDDFKSERQQYIPITVHNTSVNECKKWYEELKHQYEQEKTKLNDTTEHLKDQVNELTNKTVTMLAEKNEFECKLKTADKYAKKSETKILELEHSLHEVQLSRSACRKQLHKAMNFAKDLVSEQESLLKALNHRQQENKVVKKIGTDIASRMDMLRNELKSVQKEAWQELSTVEERIQEQDSIITTMKEEHEQEVERLKQIIKNSNSHTSVQNVQNVKERKETITLTSSQAEYDLHR